MKLVGVSGTKYHLGPTPIGSGGEGDIYPIRDMNDRAAKIYKVGVLTRELEEKLLVMIGHPPDSAVLTQVARPLDMACDSSGKCRGFIMPKLSINAEIREIYKCPPTLQRILRC